MFHPVQGFLHYFLHRFVVPPEICFSHALLHHFLKQPPEHLPEGRFPPAKLRDGAVIRDPIQQIQSQIPPQGHIGLDALLDLPLLRDAVQVSHQQVLYQHHRVDGRPAVPAAVQLFRLTI